LKHDNDDVDDDDDDDDIKLIHLFTLNLSWIAQSVYLWVTGWTIGVLGFDSRRALVIFFHHRIQNGSGANPASYPMGIRGSFLGGKAAGA
jgi:hypothetical protein